MFAHPQPTTTLYNTGSLTFTRGPRLEEMRAKSAQMACERRKVQTTVTCQSNINTNHHPANYCQLSAVLNPHIRILSKVFAWTIPPQAPGQPKQSCSGAAQATVCLEGGSPSTWQHRHPVQTSQGDGLYLRCAVRTLTVVFVVRSWWRKTLQGSLA